MTDDVKAPTLDEKLIATLTNMNHNARDNEGWTPEGFPDVAWLSASVGEPVTREDVLRVDPAGYPRDPDVIKSGKEGDSETEGAVAPPQPKEPVIDIEAMRAKRVELETKIAKALKDEAAAKALRQSLETALDKLITAVDQAQRGSQAEMQQRMFASNDAANAERMERVKQFQTSTGGIIPSKFASRLDEHNASKRNTMRRAARLGLTA